MTDTPHPLSQLIAVFGDRAPAAVAAAIAILEGRREIVSHATPDGAGGFVITHQVVDVPESIPDCADPDNADARLALSDYEPPPAQPFAPEDWDRAASGPRPAKRDGFLRRPLPGI